MREIEAAATEKAAQGKMARLEAQLFRQSKKADEREDAAMYVRAQSYIKLRTLFKVGGRGHTLQCWVDSDSQES